MKDDKAFYSLSVDGRSYAFRKPEVSQIDRFASRMTRAPLSAALDFTRELALEPEAWTQATAERPGLALAAANGIMEALGFLAG